MLWRKVRRASTIWFLALSLMAPQGWAEIFSHREGAEHFEATVSAERLVVKERYQGTTTIYGDLSCPLGPAVRATILPSAGGRLCFTFAPDRCEYTRFQDGSAIHTEELASARTPRMCIALASMDEAQRLAAHVNMGPQQARIAASDNAEEPKSRVPPGVPDKRADPSKRVPPTPEPAQRTTQPASGGTHTAAERVQVYSSDDSARGARAESARPRTPVGAPLALFVHVRNHQQRAEVERLIEPLSARGIRVTGIKLMDAGPLSTDLRYFYPDDARQTGEVVRALRSVGLPLPRLKHIKGFENRATPRQYELWLSPTDRPSKISAGRTR